MAPYLMHNSIHTPEVQYGPYTALGIVYSWSNEDLKSNFAFTIQFCQITILSLFRAFTITFWKWKAFRCPNICSRYILRVLLSICPWMNVNLVCLYHISSHKTHIPQNWKKKHFLSGKKLISKMGLFFKIWRKYGSG